MIQPDIQDRVSRLDERMRAHTHLLGGLRLNQEDAFAEMNQRLAKVEDRLARLTLLLTTDRPEPDTV